MPILAFDHVNIRTNNLETLITWYTNILGLRAGARPDFNFPGAWMYLGDRALVHLVGTEADMKAGGPVTLEHFAFRATGMQNFRDMLEVQGIAYSVDPVPGMPIVQINFRDPDGNHIHVDFDAAEFED